MAIPPINRPPVEVPNLAPAKIPGFGFEIDQIKSPPAGAGTNLQFPFQIQKVDDDTVNVRYGTLMDIEPTNVGDDIDVSGTDTFTFYLDVEIDINGVVIAATLSNSTSGQPADSDYHGYITLGTVVVASDVITVINQAATHSLRMAMCGRVVTDGVLITRGTYEFWGF